MIHDSIGIKAKYPSLMTTCESEITNFQCSPELGDKKFFQSSNLLLIITFITFLQIFSIPGHLHYCLNLKTSDYFWLCLHHISSIFYQFLDLCIPALIWRQAIHQKQQLAFNIFLYHISSNFLSIPGALHCSLKRIRRTTKCFSKVKMR